MGSDHVAQAVLELETDWLKLAWRFSYPNLSLGLKVCDTWFKTVQNLG